MGQLHVQTLNYTRKIIFNKLLKKVILSWLAKRQVLFLNNIKRYIKIHIDKTQLKNIEIQHVEKSFINDG